jgi:hypothetical protein
VRLVLVRSTIAPAMLRRVLDRHRTATFAVVANPEFLRGNGRDSGFRSSPFLVFGGTIDWKQPRRQRDLRQRARSQTLSRTRVRCW